MIPFIVFDKATLEEVNLLLRQWEHKMGPLLRPEERALCHVLRHEGEPVALTTTSVLIRTTAGGIPWLNDQNTVELSRLCAARPGLCRVALRLWREFVFPALGKEYAVSYQDANIHTGDVYRFDGWRRVGYSHSGYDQRGQRQGRNKWLWVWPANAQVKWAAAELEAARG